MKRTLLLLIILLPAFSHAQTFGVKGGFNLSQMKGVPNSDVYPGFRAGIFMTESLNYNHNARRWNRHRHLLYLETELLYNRMGAKMEDNVNKIKYQADYLTLNLLMRYNPIPKIGLEAGPYAAYKARDNFHRSHADNTGTELHDFMGLPSSANEHRPLKVRSMDYGISFGIKYTTYTFVDFSVRYDIGLYDVVRNNPSKDKVYNRVLSISASIDLW